MHRDSEPLYPQVYPATQLQPMEKAMSPSSSVANQAQGLPVAMESLLGPENTVTVCRFCNSSIKTAVKYSSTSRTHMAAALWCLACCLCCVPYGSDSAKNSDHYCPNCQRYLGTYEK